MTVLTKITNQFENTEITTLTYKGKPAWIAADIERALEYSINGTRLVTEITKSWPNELDRDKDYTILRGEELAEFKALYKTDPESGSVLKGSHIMRLFEPALHFVCLKTNKPIGKKLRRFLIDEVLPQLARDGRYSPDREVVDNRISTRRHIDNSKSILREERLATWQWYQMQNEKSQAQKS